jgi:hypothetical protein
MPKRKGNKISSRNLRKRFKHSDPEFSDSDPDFELINKFKKAALNISVSSTAAGPLPEVWRRNERVMRANVALKSLCRQDPTEELDLLNISRVPNSCYYSWHDIELIEHIIHNMCLSTLTCKDKKCFYHCRRF